MPTWKWEGLDKNGRRSKGQVVASDEKEVRKLLRGQGVRPKKIIAPSILELDLGEWMVEKGLAKSFGTKELVSFTKKLSIMLNSGVPIIPALEVLHKSEKHPTLKRTIKQVSSDVSEGSTVSEALVKRKGFSKLYCNLVKAGEAAGILDEILNKLTEHMEKQQKLKSQIKGAMTYPAIVCVVGIGVIWGLMVFVVPQFLGMLEGSGQDIPWVTQFVVDVSEAFQEHTLTAVPVLFVLSFILKVFIDTEIGKMMFDKFMMNLPIFGGIVIKGNLSSFSRTLATMLSSGISLVDALDICIETLDNEVIAADLRDVRKKVTEGQDMTDPISRITYFPDMVAQMVKVGEQTGSLDQMFLRISEVFEDEVNSLVGNMTKLIEPFIIVVLGGIVATVLVAMYLPIFMSAEGAM